MTRRVLSAVTVATLVVLLGGSLTARAQDTGLPVTPDPSECTAEPLTFDDILARVLDSGASPVPIVNGTPAAFTLPAGTPADDATAAEITAVLREVIACINTGNFLTIFAYATDTFLLQLLAEEEGSEAAPPEGTPEALNPEQYASLVAVHDVVMLPDGRVGALAETVFPDEEPGIQVDYFVFVQEEGRWLLDEIHEDLEGQFPPQGEMGTPAAA